MMNRTNKFLIIFLVATLFIVSAKVLHAQESYKVVDGDSLEYGSIRIRLIDIDAPELFQYCYDENNIKHECGKRALTELKKYVNSKISCQEVSVDRYKRKLMECFDENGESINRKMVLNGWALSYGDRFKDEEKLAKNQKNGIWSGRFMRPELYRALNKNQKNNKKFKKR